MTTPPGRADRAPAALAIAGSDSGGGAGIQADLKTFSALGVYGASAVTALTAQNTRQVRGVQEVPPDFVVRQIDAVLDDIAIDAIKLGMLGSSAVIGAVADRLERVSQPIVIDPVMVAKSGDALLQPDAVETLRARLVPLAAILTPNLPEAARLLGCVEAATATEMAEQGRALLDLGAGSVLMKGGHGTGETCTDLLVRRDGPVIRLDAPRQRTVNTHGTGCTLSSAVAALLARGRPLVTAVADAHAFLQRAMAAADRLGVGQGHGPVHHFHAFWGRA